MQVQTLSLEGTRILRASLFQFVFFLRMWKWRTSDMVSLAAWRLVATEDKTRLGSKKFPTGPTEWTPKLEYLVPYLKVCW